MAASTPSDLASAAGEKIDPVLETLCFSDDTQIVLSKLTDGKFKATSKSWDEGKVILPHQVLEVRLVDGRIHGRPATASRARAPDSESPEFLGV